MIADRFCLNWNHELFAGNVQADVEVVKLRARFRSLPPFVLLPLIHDLSSTRTSSRTRTVRSFVSELRTFVPTRSRHSSHPTVLNPSAAATSESSFAVATGTIRNES